jgi:hypothetical protein
MNIFYTAIVTFCLFSIRFSFSQVGIGTTTPNSSAALEVSSSNKGFLLPRVALTSAQDMTTIPNPVQGLMIYNTSELYDNMSSLLLKRGFYYFTGQTWVLVTDKSNQNTVRSGDMDLFGDDIYDVATVSAGKFYIYDQVNHPFYNGAIPEAYSSIQRSGNKTFFQDELTQTKLLTLVHDDPANGLLGNVGVGTFNPSSSALLDLTSSTKGFLPPRVSLSSITSASPITSPATGLLVYNTATSGVYPNNVSPGYYYYNGVKWVNFITNPYLLSVKKTSAQSITTAPGVVTVNNWEAPYLDNTGGSWNSTSGVFTVPRTGNYKITASLLFQVSGLLYNTEFSVQLLKNGTNVGSNGTFAQVTNSFYSKFISTGTLVSILSLVQGDQLKVAAFQNSGTSVSTYNPNGNFNYLMIEEIR